MSGEASLQKNRTAYVPTAKLNSPVIFNLIACSKRDVNVNALKFQTLINVAISPKPKFLVDIYD